MQDYSKCRVFFGVDPASGCDTTKKVCVTFNVEGKEPHILDCIGECPFDEGEVKICEMT